MYRLLIASLFVALTLTSAAAQNTSVGDVRLEGQVVCCADCWAEADRNVVEYGSAEDLLKAKSCVEGGDPTLLAVKNADKAGYTLYQLEQGKYRLPGENWLEYVGKRVVVTGTTRKQKKANIVRVDALDVTGASLAEREAGAVVGSEVAFTAKDLFGAEQKLDQYKGRIVVLNFWATYCVPCRAEMPDLAAIQNEYAALGLQVIGASADAAEDRAKVLQFIKETRINFPVWTGATSTDMSKFGLGGALPGTVIVGSDGKVARVISGIVNRADLKKEIDTMLASAEKTAEATRVSDKREQIAATKPKAGEASTVPS